MYIINNNYQVHQIIGQGAQASIMSGTDLKTTQAIALKIIDVKTKSGAAAFTNELEIQKKMSRVSKFICETIECLHVPAEGLGIVVMKKYETDLFDYCFGQKQKLSSHKIKQLFKQVCAGVYDLHASGIAHLDIKPDNILIDARGNAVLSDFGSSYDNMRPMKGCLYGRGTRCYQAPEVRVSDHYDPFKADMYSIGALLHVIATGFFPNNGDLTFASHCVDQDCYSLLTMLLKTNPEERLTIGQVAYHQYLN